MCIGNLAGYHNEGNAEEAPMHAQQLIEFVVDDASTIVREDVNAQPCSTIRYCSQYYHAKNCIHRMRSIIKRPRAHKTQIEHLEHKTWAFLPWLHDACRHILDADKVPRHIPYVVVFHDENWCGQSLVFSPENKPNMYSMARDGSFSWGYLFLSRPELDKLQAYGEWKMPSRIFSEGRFRFDFVSFKFCVQTLEAMYFVYRMSLVAELISDPCDADICRYCSFINMNRQEQSVQVDKSTESPRVDRCEKIQLKTMLALMSELTLKITDAVRR